MSRWPRRPPQPNWSALADALEQLLGERAPDRSAVQRWTPSERTRAWAWVTRELGAPPSVRSAPPPFITEAAA